VSADFIDGVFTTPNTHSFSTAGPILSANNVNNANANHTSSAFQPVPSASSEGAQPPPVHPAVKTTPPGGGQRVPSPSNSSTASGDSNSPLHDDDEARLGGGGGDPREKAFDWPAHSSYDERR
jgi:hypothetical protein